MVEKSEYDKAVEEVENRARKIEREREMLMKKISNRFASTDAGQVMKGMINQREDLEKRKQEAEIELEKENEKSKNESFLMGSDNHRMGLVI